MTLPTRNYHVVMFSGGVSSWATAKRVVERNGTTLGVALLFADTRIEDPDLYRFIQEAAANVGVPLTWLQEGRTPWQVFHDERMIGNARLDPCSKILKRQLLRRYLDEHYAGVAEHTSVHLGYDWEEGARIERARGYWSPYTLETPLADRPYLSKADQLEWLKEEGIRPPRLYEMGFTHNNCGGFCVKAGWGHFRRLLHQLPEVYAVHEQEEQRLRDYLGKDVSVLVDQSGQGPRRPLTLHDFRLKVEGERGPQAQFPMLLDQDDGATGCGCFDTREKEEGN